MQQSKEPQQQHDKDNAFIDNNLTRMNTCLQQAIEDTVPSKKRLSTEKRAISDGTRQLYEARTRKFSAIAAEGGKVTKQLRKRWNRKITAANLSDYNEWLTVMAGKMEEADRKGDSETIFRLVKIMSGLMTTASNSAPSTDEQGNLILDQKALAKAWK